LQPNPRTWSRLRGRRAVGLTAMMAGVNDDLGDDAATTPANPLLRPLEPVELDLLEAIWDPIAREVAPWPVWDYVSRTLYKGPLRVRDAGAVLASMPRMPDPMLGALDGRAYGLVWRDAIGPGPAGEEHVGLTIAGLVRLSEWHAPLKVLADHLTEIISSLAAAERDTIADPLHAVRPALALDSYIQGITVRTADHLIPIPAPVVLAILRREHAPLMITAGSESPKARPTIYVRAYSELAGADDYLERIALMSQRRERPAPIRRGEELVQTLDYVSHVFEVHPAWTMGPLVVTHDLETASTLSADVTNQVEFSYRLSALASILAGLQVPELNPNHLKQHDTRPGPLIRLADWLKDFIQDEGGGQRAAEAIKDIRSANDLRVQTQHTGTKPRNRATQARSRLGIEDPIRDWGLAWEIVRARVADAFDIIRNEVAAQPKNTD
jgi:hypothetical protein